MRIALVQMQSQSGQVDYNLERHLYWANRTLKHQVDGVLFPELSLTGYEPSMAKSLATESNNFDGHRLQSFCDEHQVFLLPGMPTKSSSGIRISQLIYRPKMDTGVYSKLILHEDEFPYFETGSESFILAEKKERLAPVICYESMQTSRTVQAIQDKASIYAALVAKTDLGVKHAHTYFALISRQYELPVLMVNCVGLNDHSMHAGGTAVWNRQGEMLAQLSDQEEGIIIYDTTLQEASIHY